MANRILTGFKFCWQRLRHRAELIGEAGFAVKKSPGSGNFLNAEQIGVKILRRDLPVTGGSQIGKLHLFKHRLTLRLEDYLDGFPFIGGTG